MKAIVAATCLGIGLVVIWPLTAGARTGVRPAEIEGQIAENVRSNTSAPGSFVPENQGAFAHAAQSLTFPLGLQVTGTTSVEIFDLTASSEWPLVLYGPNGQSLLVDTNGNGLVDTGQILPGEIYSMTVKVLTPAVVNVGDDNTVLITATAALTPAPPVTAAVQSAVPSPFAQLFTQIDPSTSQFDSVLMIAHPEFQKSVTASIEGGSSKIDPAITESTAYVYIWSQFPCLGPCDALPEGLEYALVSHEGELIRAPQVLVEDQSNGDPVVAASPGGTTGAAWWRIIWNDQGLANMNIFFALLDEAGDVVAGPTNLTQYDTWGSLYNPIGLIQTWEPRIVSTSDGHFVVAWSQLLEEPAGLIGDVYYMVLDAGGATIKGPTRFTDDALGGEIFGLPALASMQGDRFLLAHAVPGGVTFAIFDSAGSLLHQGPVIPVPVASVAGSGIDAVELSDGTILLAWTDGPTYVLIDGANYNLLTGPISLNSPAGFLSVTSAPTGHGVLTWQGLYSGATNLYYALIDSAGNVVVQPLVFRSRPLGFGLGDTGYNNAPYTVQPTAAGVDLLVASPSLAAGPPGGVGAIPIHLENAGASPAQSVTITATLGSGLSYLRDSSGITPTVIGSTLAWQLPDLAFLGNGKFDLYVHVPDVPVGLEIPVMLEIASADPDANPVDNQAAVSVMVAHQWFFPVLLD